MKKFRTNSHDDVSLENKLPLRGSVDVSNVAGIRAVNERWSANVIPHLPRSHCKHEKLKHKTNLSINVWISPLSPLN